MDANTTIADVTSPRRRLYAVTRLLLLLLALLTPLWINPWGQDPFELPKVALARTLIWLLGGLALAEAILSGARLSRLRRPNPVLGAAFLLAVAVVAATVGATDRGLSLWGSLERVQGAVTLLSYLLLFLVGVRAFRRPARGRVRWTQRVLQAVAAGTIPIVGLGLAQALGWDPLGLAPDARSSIDATFGRAGFAGGYLAIVTPLTLAAALLARSRGRRALWLSLLALQVGVIALTGAPAAWIATVVALALFALLRWGGRMPSPVRIGAWSATGLLALGGPLTVLGVGSRQAGSAAVRVTVWRATLDLIRQRPWLGHGPDALGLVFHGVTPPELLAAQGSEVMVDRAGNLFLDWAVTTGVLGLGALLAVLATFAWLIVRALRRPQSASRRTLLIAALAGVAASTTHALLSSDATPTATVTWLLLGLGTALALPEAPVAPPVAGRPALWRRATAVVLLLGIGVAAVQINVRPLLADVAARTAERAASRGDLAAALAGRQAAIDWWPAEPAHHLALADTAWQLALADPPASEAWLAQAETALVAAQQLRPTDPLIWLQSAKLYTSIAQDLGGDTRRLATAAFEAAAARAPNSATLYATWGAAELEAGAVERAAALLRRAVELDPTDGDAMLRLGQAYLSLYQSVEAQEAYRQAVRLLPSSAEAYAGLAESYRRRGDREEALVAAQRALRLDPRNTLALGVLQTVGGIY